MNVSIIAAMSENRVIGRDGTLPWRLPDDLARFQRLTLDHAVIMGRRTYQSLGVSLPRRRLIVLSRDARFTAAVAVIAPGIAEAIDLARERGETSIFIAGGGEIYAQTIDLAQRLYLTVVHATIRGDTLFPPIDERAWRLVDEQRHDADDRHPFAFSFRIYDRAAAPATNVSDVSRA